jgi:hypothetical protein
MAPFLSVVCASVAMASRLFPRARRCPEPSLPVYGTRGRCGRPIQTQRYYYTVLDASDTGKNVVYRPTIPTVVDLAVNE